MEVSQIEIDGFRSIKSSALKDLSRFAVLVGPNNSGKSNVAAAIRLFRTVFRGGPTPRVSDISAFSGGNSFEVRLFIKLSNSELDPLLTGVANSYDLTGEPRSRVLALLGRLGDGFVLVGRFTHTRPGQDVLDMRGDVLLVGRMRLATFLDAAQGFPFDGRAPPGGMTMGAHVSDAVATALGGYVCDRLLSLHPIRRPASAVGATPLTDFEPDATNLANALFLHSGSDSVEYRQLQSWIKEVFPDLERVVTSPPVGSNNTVTLSVRERGIPFPVPADAISSGVIEAIAILARLAFSPEGSLITIEEPELHFHQGSLRRLVHRLVVESSKRQLLIVTHSGEILDNQQVGPFIWYADRHGAGPSQFLKLNKIAFISWLQSQLSEDTPDSPGRTFPSPPPDITVPGPESPT